jgi:amino acid adenylation domain-containing protein/FkbM family methyltransferase
MSRLGAQLRPLGPPLFKRRSTVYRRKSLVVSQELPHDVRAALPADADATRVHASFLAAVAAVLFRYAGTEQPTSVVVGSPLPSDSNGEDGDADVLPLVLDVGPESHFADLVSESERLIAEAAAHADVSAAELLESLAMSEVVNRHPLFDVVVRTVGLHPEIADARNDVTISVDAAGGSPSIELEYNGNVHDEATVARFGDHVTRFLGAALLDDDASVASVPLLAPEEHASLEELAGSTGPFPDKPLQLLLEEAVEAYADTDALISGERVVSYADMNAKANAIAHHLLSLGVKRGDAVGLCVPASPDLLIAAIAILKTGAAAVPLVPTFPAARNALTIEDSKMPVAVTVSSLVHHFPDPGPRLVLLDDEAEAIDAQPTTNPDVGADIRDVLYIMFTSGSTGRPKGVAVEHRTVVNLVAAQRERGLDPRGARTLQRTSIGFDVSFQEIFSTLCYGGTLVVATDEVRDDVSQLAEFADEHSIARMFLPPVALDQVAMSAGLQQRTLTNLREIIVAGEQLRISMPTRRFFHGLPSCTLDNQYGPTETHVATAYMLDGPSTRWPETPPIGKPVQNVRVYILDAWGQRVPVGVAGELFVGGVAPARGYLSEADTRASFVPDPFVDDGEARMYRTGDRARFLPDGNIEFLGRDDDQVKIRGYRIELGEIEACIQSVPGVRQAAVAVHELDTVGKQLAGYVVTEGDQEPSPERIRELVLDMLPGHMVPPASSIMYMESLPTTPTGKVDRRALPVPERPGRGDPTAVARGDTEKAVADLWAHTLGVEAVGRDDNFIDLGGHSLVGIQIVSQINELYSIALPLRTLLGGASVAAVARQIDSLRGLDVDVEDEGEGEADRDGAEAATTDGAGPRLTDITLPNGMRVACLQKAETEYLYVDVFEHRTYDRGGIEYPAEGLVVDAGAHIGLFTLYALAKSPGLNVAAFEPCPPLFEALERNTGHLENVERFAFGLGRRNESADLTFYPELTGMSSFRPDEAEERALLSGILRNLAQGDEGGVQLAESQAYLEERVVAEQYTCELRPLSDVLATLGAEQVDLLKIDVQKAELDLLEGISDSDWGRIRQVAVEVHDLDGMLERIQSLLAGRGYDVTVEQDPLHAGTRIHFVYAV